MKDHALTFFIAPTKDAIPVYLVEKTEADRLPSALSKAHEAYARALGFSGDSGRLLILSDDKGKVAGVLFGIGGAEDPFVCAKLITGLPAGDYVMTDNCGIDADTLALGLLLGSYHYSRYKTTAPAKAQPRFVAPAGCDEKAAAYIAKAVFLARDLVNTPASDMGPAELAKAAIDLGGLHGADVAITLGDDLLKNNLPMIHAVGRASADAPRLIDLTWGRDDDPKVTLVGKGVCFDSGGLNLKPASSITLMKKDMGGAANALGLASMIMDAKLPVRLRLLIPAVENAISGNAFRPGDVLQSRLGLSVEIENTDAEGRLVLADALALGDEEAPDLMIDLATLTGAARVALGPELPPFYTDDEALACDITAAANAVNDPLWRMPLWPPYAAGFASKVADLCHTSPGGFAGSVTAALFLQKFVSKAGSWVHFDIYAWNPKARPGREVGGEAQSIRALFKVLSDRYR